MRGIVSAGMVSALQYLGLRDSFDGVYGSSAGAINGAYFLAGQAPFGTTIYYENINNSRFINPLRMVIGRPMVSVGFAYDHVMRFEKPLHWRKLVDSDIPLHATLTSVATGQAISKTNFRTEDEVFSILKASATMPFAAGPPARIGGELYLDGGFVCPVPTPFAIADGCTHLLVLLTRPDYDLRGTPSLFERTFLAWHLKKLSLGLRDVLLSRAAKYKTDIEELKKQSANHGSTPVIFVVQLPRSMPEVRRTEKKRARLVAAASDGMQAVLEAFGVKDRLIQEVLAPLSASGEGPGDFSN